MIEITEVGPRDGLQNEGQIVSTEDKLELLKRLAQSGVQKIEAVSFVNPKVIPQMADAEAVMQQVPRDTHVQYAGLVLSQSGVERALRSNLDVIHIAMATSDTFNLKNARRTVAESVTEISSMIQEIRSAGLPVTVCLGTTFGCPFEGRVTLADVLHIAEQFLEVGCTGVTLADTVGVANPAQVSTYVSEFRERFGTSVPLGLHFHNTRGLGIANVYAGFMAGVTQFDTSIGGLGGCPFAPKAVGNVCTEDVVNMFEEMSVQTHIDVHQLIDTANWIEPILGHRLDGMLMKAGLVRHGGEVS